MDRVHGKCIHHKRLGMASEVSLGQGGVFWIYFAMILFNYKCLTSEPYKMILLEIMKDLWRDMDMCAILVLLAMNAARWMLAWYFVEKYSRFVFSCLIGAAVGLEGVAYRYKIRGVSGVIIRYASIAQLMKLISYLLATRETVTMGREQQNMEPPITETTLARFICYPTMCYQPRYPTSPRISLRRLFFYALSLIPSAVLGFFCLKKKCLPLAHEFLSRPSFGLYLDIILWVNLGWVSCFILGFVGMMGILGELTFFGDCRFFGAWWDSTPSEYWRRWNIPVHSWIKRHVHRALLRKNITTRTSRLAIFVLSGAVHEYVISDSAGRMGIGFFTMASQLPIRSIVTYAQEKMGISRKISTAVLLNIVGAPLILLIARF